MTILSVALKRNKTLSHLSIKGCDDITDEGLEELKNVIADHNMVLFQVDLDKNQFDLSLAE